MFPSRDEEEPLVGLPLTLPMGWKESPPHFCSTTETVADLANQAIQSNRKFGPHRLDATSEESSEPDSKSQPPQLPPLKLRHCNKPLRSWDVHVDDFLGLVQGNEWQRRQVKRALLHSLDLAFRGLSPNDNSHRQEPASIKKLLKGDAKWTTRKVVLGWLIDTVKGTIELPEHRAERLHEILASIQPNQRRVAISNWHKILGELRSMALAIPGARGLFCTLQEAFRHPEKDQKRLRLHKHVHSFLEDWRWLAMSVTDRPTRIAEVVPSQQPHTIGACDASGTGMGGVHFVCDENQKLHPIMWRERFPSHIVDDLVSHNNPKGTVTNSDLELAGTTAHHDVLAQVADVTEKTIHTLSDNDPTVHWQTKGSATTTGPAAYLLRLQALHSRHYRYLARCSHIPGWANLMADICRTLDTLPRETADEFRADFGLVQEAIRTGVTSKRATAHDHHWIRWNDFCSIHNLDPFLRQCADPVPILQVFGQRCRDGRIAPSGRQVASRTVEDALRAVAQTHASLGAPDPRKDDHGKTDFRITRQLRSYAKADPPPKWVKPVPITVALYILRIAHNITRTDDAKAVADMICLAFHFSLRPGEHTGTAADDQPFLLENVQLHLGTRPIHYRTAPPHRIRAATSVTFTFATQKNNNRNEQVAHGRSNHPLCCPVKAAIRLLIYHRTMNAPCNKPLASHCNTRNRRVAIAPKDVTEQLRAAATATLHITGIPADSISARSLRAGGAVALLCGNVDFNVIKMLGRWHSDTMLRYLHVQAQPIVQHLAVKMFNRGQCSFLPTDAAPANDD